jgi:hypothetical protein
MPHQPGARPNDETGNRPRLEKGAGSVSGGIAILNMISRLTDA